MVARVRNNGETFKRYRANLKQEARSLKFRLEGRSWVVRVAQNPQLPSTKKGERMRGLDGTMFGTFKHHAVIDDAPAQ